MPNDPTDNLDSGLTYVLHSLNPLGIRWSLVFIPWRIAWYWTSICLTFALELCAYAGAPPSGYVTRSQAKQLHSVADHLHKRLGAQDKMIQQLHEDIDNLTRDKKRAMAKYAKAQKSLQQQQQQPNSFPVRGSSPQRSPELPDYSSVPAPPQKHYAMHVSVGLAALCAWWYFLQDVPALERKLLSVLLTPICYFYVSSIMTKWRQWSSIFMYCAAWFLIGFVNCRRLGQFYV